MRVTLGLPVLPLLGAVSLTLVSSQLPTASRAISIKSCGVRKRSIPNKPDEVTPSSFVGDGDGEDIEEANLPAEAANKRGSGQ